MSYHIYPDQLRYLNAAALLRLGFSKHVVAEVLNSRPATIRGWEQHWLVDRELKRLGNNEEFIQTYLVASQFEAAQKVAIEHDQAWRDRMETRRIMKEEQAQKSYVPEPKPRDLPSSVIERQIRADAADWDRWLMTGEWPKGKLFPYGKAVSEGYKTSHFRMEQINETTVRIYPSTGRADVSAF